MAGKMNPEGRKGLESPEMPLLAGWVQLPHLIQVLGGMRRFTDRESKYPI